MTTKMAHNSIIAFVGGQTNGRVASTQQPIVLCMYLSCCIFKMNISKNPNTRSGVHDLFQIQI
jgi:hypothetical protein